MSAYSEAVADPHHTELWPGMVIRPFHRPVPGMPDLYHVHCASHPEFGARVEEVDARVSALAHWEEDH